MYLSENLVSENLFRKIFVVRTFSGYHTYYLRIYIHILVTYIFPYAIVFMYNFPGKLFITTGHARTRNIFIGCPRGTPAASRHNRRSIEEPPSNPSVPYCSVMYEGFQRPPQLFPHDAEKRI